MPTRAIPILNRMKARLGVSQGGRPWGKNPTARSIFMFKGACYYGMNRGTAGPVVSQTDEQRQWFFDLIADLYQRFRKTIDLALT